MSKINRTICIVFAVILLFTTLSGCEGMTSKDQSAVHPYSYDAKLVLEHSLLPVGPSAAFLFSLILLFVLFLSFLLYKKRNDGKRLKDQMQNCSAELQQLDQDLETALKNAEAASLAKTAFLASFSHEIRTPMNSIIGFSELAMNDDISDKTKEYLSKIIESSYCLLKILNDVLDVSKIEAGKLELEYIPFDLHEIFTQCRTLIMPMTIEKGLVLHFYAEPIINKRLVGDPTRLHQIFINLLTNAVKFTNVGVVKLSASIVSIDDASTTIYFDVRDSGIGMTPEQIGKIFKPYVQADSSMTRLHGGTGLGLSITKSIIEMMGGSLTVESTPKVGSKFSFELTFKTIDLSDNNDAVDQDNVIVELEKPYFEGEILICEDNLMNQRVVREHLEMVGLKTLTTVNGKECVEVVGNRKAKGEKPFDLIFMDMHMPVMDGLEAAFKIVELNTGTPIVAMTANIMGNDCDIFETNGISDCLAKPFTSQELWCCLLKHLTPVSNECEDEYQSDQADSRLQTELPFDFVKENQSVYSDIVNAVDANDIKTARRLVHTLKSSAAHIKRLQLQTAAADVERVLADGKTVPTKEQMSTLETELNAVLSEFAPLLHSAANNVHKLFEQLEPLLIKGNPDCRNFIDGLQDIPGSDKLIQFINDFKFKMALKALDEIKHELGMK